MKPQLLKIPHEPSQSFNVRQDRVPNLNNRWHYHEEVELICFHKGAGTQFIGDHIKKFTAGDIVLLGSNLPHYFMYDETYLHPDDDKNVYATVIHFSENFLGERFLHLPETRHVKLILEKARRGLLISGDEAKLIGSRIGLIYQSGGLSRITTLIECLSAFAELNQLVPLSSVGFQYNVPDSESSRMNGIYNYTFNNFKKKINLKEIASQSGLIPNSFCRYFKLHTGKTYTKFLLDIRIGFACKLLLDNKYSIKQVCFESGFNNFSCFHKSFKLITGKTPQNYQKEYIKN